MLESLWKYASDPVTLVRDFERFNDRLDCESSGRFTRKGQFALIKCSRTWQLCEQ